MTREQAIYYKYLLICGYSDELNRYIDICLNDEDPISDIILNLTTCGADNKKTLSVLNEFVTQVPEEEIDYDKVFDLVLAFLRSQYNEKRMPIETLSELMYRISVLTDKTADDPWWTMNILGDLFFEAKVGYITMESFMDVFQSFMNEGVCIGSSVVQLPRKKCSLIKRLYFRLKYKK